MNRQSGQSHRGHHRGQLTTHVLDTARGHPAAGLRIDLFHLSGETRRLIKTDRTNNDGRVDAPLLEGDDMAAGVYELMFHAGDYIRTTPGGPGGDDAGVFLEMIPVRFTIHDPGARYHVPLLLSPFGYATYRGS